MFRIKKWEVVSEWDGISWGRFYQVLKLKTNWPKVQKEKKEKKKSIPILVFL